MLNKISKVAVAAAAAAAEKTVELGEKMTPADLLSLDAFEKWLDTSYELLTPAVIRATCVPQSDSIDNYIIQIDESELLDAIDSGKIVKPKIEIRAISDEIDRDILTERLLEAFIPVSERIENQIKEVQQRKNNRQFWEKINQEFSVLAFIFEIIFTGGSALILAVAFGGIAFVADLPRILFSKVKSAVGLTVFDSKEDREIALLKKQLEQDKNIINRAIARAEIVVDNTL